MNNLKIQFYVLISLYYLVSINYECCYAGAIKYSSFHKHHKYVGLNTELSGIKLIGVNPLDSDTVWEVADAQDNKMDAIERDSTYAIKDPGTAFKMAFGPGFFVHGLGHSYIGETKAFRFLLLSEIVSIAMNGYGFYLLFPSAYGYYNEGNSGLGGALVFTGTFIFFYSWIYDFTIAPIGARELNKLHGYSIYIYPDFQRDITSLSLRIAF